MNAAIILATACLNTIKSNNKLMKTFKDSPEVCKATMGVQVALSEFLVKSFQQEKERLENRDVDGLTDAEFELLKQGAKGRIPLIKALRERKGYGLVEAKTFTDDMFVRHQMGYKGDDGRFYFYTQYANSGY